MVSPFKNRCQAGSRRLDLMAGNSRIEGGKAMCDAECFTGPGWCLRRRSISNLGTFGVPTWHFSTKIA